MTRLILSFLAVCMGTVAFASERETSVQEVSLRAGKHFGVSLGAFGEQTLSWASVNVSYSPIERLRFGAGAGSVLWGVSYGVGAKYLWMPESSFSPYFAASVQRTTIHDGLSGAFDLPRQPDLNFWSWGPGFGIDWQTRVGFNAGIGMNVLFWSAAASDGYVEADKIVLPYATVGWMF